jgi:hypothetical protein
MKYDILNRKSRLIILKTAKRKHFIMNESEYLNSKWIFRKHKWKDIISDN